MKCSLIIYKALETTAKFISKTGLTIWERTQRIIPIFIESINCAVAHMSVGIFFSTSPSVDSCIVPLLLGHSFTWYPFSFSESRVCRTIHCTLSRQNFSIFNDISVINSFLLLGRPGQLRQPIKNPKVQRDDTSLWTRLLAYHLGFILLLNLPPLFSLELVSPLYFISHLSWVNFETGTTETRVNIECWQPWVSRISKAPRGSRDAVRVGSQQSVVGMLSTGLVNQDPVPPLLWYSQEQA